jgi:hypothetical protein
MRSLPFLHCSYERHYTTTCCLDNTDGQGRLVGVGERSWRLQPSKRNAACRLRAPDNAGLDEIKEGLETLTNCYERPSIRAVYRCTMISC